MGVFSLYKLREIVPFPLKLIAKIYIVEDRIMGGFLPFLILVNQLNTNIATKYHSPVIST